MKRHAPLMLAACLLAGCVSFGEVRPTRMEWPGAESALDPGSALTFIDRLARASAAELDAMPASRSVGPDDPHAVLRHALWLATPGHAGFDAAEARRSLATLLHDSPGFDAPMRALVRIQLRHLQARRDWLENNQRLAEENDRLREQIQALTALERRMNGDASSSGGSTP